MEKEQKADESGPLPEPRQGPANVVEAIARVMGDIGGIEKLDKEERKRRGLGGGDADGGISYAYRGIDQIAAAAQPLFAKYGVVIVPRVVESRVVDILVRNNPWTDTFVRVEWIIAGPNNTRLEGCTEGQGRDNNDKGANKAMTSAYKNLILRLLCIGDPNDDTDGHTFEADPGPTAEELEEDRLKLEKAVAVKALYERIKNSKGTPCEEALKASAKDNNTSLTEKALAADEMWFEIVKAILDEHGIPEKQEEKANG